RDGGRGRGIGVAVPPGCLGGRPPSWRGPRAGRPGNAGVSAGMQTIQTIRSRRVTFATLGMRDFIYDRGEDCSPLVGAEGGSGTRGAGRFWLLTNTRPLSSSKTSDLSRSAPTPAFAGPATT